MPEGARHRVVVRCSKENRNAGWVVQRLRRKQAAPDIQLRLGKAMIETR